MTLKSLPSLSQLSNFSASLSLERVPGDFLSTGLQAVDDLLGGGLPRGAMCELTGVSSSGKTGLLYSALARATSGGESGAYIDSFDSLDPVFAQKAGVDLKRLLWIRCRENHPEASVAKALKAADILLRTKGFGVLVLDLEQPGNSLGADAAQKIPFKLWFRLKRLLEGQPVALLILASQACCGSASMHVLELQRRQSRWHFSNATLAGSSPTRPVCLLRGLASNICLSRGKTHGHVALYCDF